jgi:2-C-methyl-D-erythritol 4-phosphate cytidylyltransferase
MSFYDDEPAQPVGVVVESERGSLPFALLHGEPLVACAAWAMGEAGIRLLDLTTPWDDVREAAAPLVWHDALCPMTPPDFLAACVRRAVDQDAVVVGARKESEGSPVVESPIVLPASVTAVLTDWPSRDFADAVRALRALARVVVVDPPDSARRVGSLDDVRALEELTRP